MFKFTFFVFVFLALSAFAEVRDVHRFRVENAQFSPSHAQSVGSANLEIDYTNSEVVLHIEQTMPACPEGRVCAQVMPDPVNVTLPITKIERDNCGMTQVTAEADFRPMDGEDRRLEIYDNSQMTCPDKTNYESVAIYETRHFDRSERFEVVARSEMSLQRVWDTFPQFSALRKEVLTMVKGSFIKGFPSYIVARSGTLVMGFDQIEMTIERSMNCQDSICPRIMPQPLHIILPITKVEKTQCGTILTAQRDLLKTEGYLEEIQINDNQIPGCHFASRPLIEVHYHSYFPGRMPNEEYEADFTFDRIAP